MKTGRTSKWMLLLALVASLAILPGATGKDKAHGDKGRGGSMKFKGLDRNNDGRITRDEWRGNDRSFSAHDKNGNGVLEGAEVGEALEEAGYDDFVEIDRTRDGRVSRDEWRWEKDDFARMDANHDGVLTRAEYLGTAGEGPGPRPDAPRDVRQPPPPTPTPTPTPTAPKTPVAEDAQARFTRLDRDGNGRISRTEWDGDRSSFNQLDDNNNDVLSREEFLEAGRAARKALFKKLDVNGSGAIKRAEWRGDKQSFSRLDVNNDDRLEQEEFLRRYHELEQNFNGMDGDHNGKLSRQEWRGDKQLFGNLDDNHDDQVSFVEFVGVS